MKIKKFFTLRVVILIIILALMLIAIRPRFSTEGLLVKSVSGEAYEAGLRANDIITKVNNIQINAIEDFRKAIEDNIIKIEPKIISVVTDKKSVSYEINNSFGFSLNNLTISQVDKNVPLDVGSKIISINNKEINKNSDFAKIKDEIIKPSKLKIETKRGPISFLSHGMPDISVNLIEKTNIKKGLDLVGGTRVLLKTENKLDEKDTESLTKILSNRLDVYGLSDIRVRPAKDLNGNIFILAEIAGASKEEVESLIAKQGKFEAKIGNDTTFEGGKKDITFVCRGDGSCSGIVPPCSPSSEGYSCRFEFTIRLSAEAAKRQASITKEISETLDGYLEKNLDLYLDNQLVDTLRISSSLKGQEANAILISGPGIGQDEKEAYKNALVNMDKLQTVLITGSLPQKLEIIKIDSISPILGESFTKNIMITTLLAFLGVSLVMFVRYRKLKIIIPIMITMLSEIIIILGFAALIQWNLDLVSIAGIIAAVGTGVDAQIVIIDETLRKENKEKNWKSKMKSAFAVIFAAYATTTVAMIPLWYAGAGLVRGLGFTTIVGITAGVFITRPAFSSMIEKILQEE